jgi:hypothetical protein
MSDLIRISDDLVASKIYQVREHKVMLDRDLATLYGVETKVLKQAVKRNIARFPEDFMFEMSQEEFTNWRSQFVTSNSDLMGLRYKPFCFTEHGVLMLSSVLNSQTAIQVNIQIMRVFSKIRQAILSQKDILLKLEQIEKQTDKYSGDSEVVFSYLKELLNPPVEERKSIGFN